MDATELYYGPATQLAAAMCTKECSPTEVVSALLEHIDQLNAYCTPTAEQARSAATEASYSVSDKPNN